VYVIYTKEFPLDGPDSLVIQNGPRKSSPCPYHSASTEINTVARTLVKQKAGYFFVAHPVQTTPPPSSPHDCIMLLDCFITCKF
jgi:hypothetical protein